MKRYLLSIVFAIIFFTGAMGAVKNDIFLANAESTTWRVQNGVSTGGKLEASGTGDMTAIYSQKQNLKTGVIIRYKINEFTLNGEVSGDESYKQKIVFSFLTDDGQNGITIVVKPIRNDKDKSKYQKMMVCSCYTVGGVAMEERSPSWEMDTYVKVFEGDHTLSIQYLTGSYYIEVDGRVIPPYRPANKLDLSAVVLTIKTHSAMAATPAKLNIQAVASERSAITSGDWLDMGPSKQIKNADGTITYKDIDEQHTADYPGGNYWMKNHIGAVRGYDVTKPIKLQLHYNTNGSGVWWGLYFPNQPFMPFDQEKNSIDYDDDLVKCRGVQFDNMPPFKARPYWRTQAGDVATPDEDADNRLYNPNGVSVAYSKEADLSTIEILVGVESTTIKFNGELLWDNFRLKQSDFSVVNGGDGKIYPMFEFIETPATHTRGVDLTIKGINTPTITSERVLIREKQDAKNIILDVIDPDNGELILLDGTRTEIAHTNYSYNGGKLTINADVFKDLAVNAEKPYNFYIANNGGLESFCVRILAEIVQLQPAVFIPNSYKLESKGGATSDLQLVVDLKNGTFKSFVGGGLTNSQFTFTEPESGSTEAKLVIKKEWLNNLKNGETILRLTTKDVAEETAVTEFKITIGKAQPVDPETPGKDDGNKKGCGGATIGSSGVNGGLMVGLLAVTFVGCLLILRKKQA